MGEVGCGDGGGGRGRATEVDVVRDREGDMHGKSAKKENIRLLSTDSLFSVIGLWALKIICYFWRSFPCRQK
jgi:hypothetical protein